MSILAVDSDEATGDVPPAVPASSDAVPAWMAARRERQTAKDVAPADSAEERSPVEGIVFEEVSASDDGVPFVIPPALPVKQHKSGTKSLLSLATDKAKNVGKKEQKKVGVSPLYCWISDWISQWVSRQGLIGVSVSLLIHSLALLALAFIVISHVNKSEELSLTGVSENGEIGGGDILIDTALPSEPGESAPLQTIDVSQIIDAVGTMSKEAQSGVEFGSGGHGKGGANSGDGTGMGVPSLKIPGHAQTKGSFSAWPEPRDPKPGQNYYVVIQIRLPRAAHGKKYKGSDLSGSVVGTDKYRQEIRYKSGETFPVEEGTVEIRILVPGGAQRVRDTINVESKLLREKQTFEIEF